MAEYDGLFTLLDSEKRKTQNTQNLLEGKEQNPIPTIPLEPEAEPYRATFESMQDEEVAKVGTAIYNGKKFDPILYSRADALSEKMGMPIDLVLRNMDEVRSQERMKDLQGILDVNPHLRNWVIEDPRRINKVEPNDLKKVAGVEWMMKAGKGAWELGLEDLELARIRYAEVVGRATPIDIARGDYLSRKVQTDTLGAEGWIEKGWTGLARTLPFMVSPVQTSAPGAVAGAITGATTALVAGQLGPQVALPEELVTVPAGAAAGWAVMMTTGVVNDMYRLNTGLAYNEFREFTDETGERIDPDVAKMAAMLTGVPTSILETFSLQKTLGQIPGVDKAVGRITTDSMKVILKNPTYRAALKRMFLTAGTAAGTEIGTEVIQEGLQITFGEMAKAFEGGAFEGLTAEEISARMAAVALQTAQVMTLMGPLVAGPKFLHDVSKVRKAEQTRVKLANITKQAQDDELVKRDPATASAAVDAVMGGPDASPVNMPATEVLELFQNDQEAAYQFGEKMAGWRQRLDDAIQTGGDVTVTMGEYYSHFAGTDLVDKFNLIAKLNPLDMPVSEVEKLNVMINEVRKKAIDNAMDSYLKEPEKSVARQVQDTAVEAKIPETEAKLYGELYGEFFKVMAERAGVDEKELFARYNLQIQQEEVASDLPVDDERTLLQTVYHGSRHTFEKFDLTKLGSGIGGAGDGYGLYFSSAQEIAEFYRGIFDLKTKIPPGKEIPLLGKGPLYKAEIPEDPDFLDYEKMFEEQSPKVQAAYSRLINMDKFRALADKKGWKISGRLMYEALSKKLGSEQAASEALAAEGIAGHIYKDNAAEYKEFNNYVVYDDKLIKAVEIMSEAETYFQKEEGSQLNTDTPAFKKWFEGSQVLDDKGRPLVVYHGTMSDIEAFDPNLFGAAQDTTDEEGFFFSHSPTIASTYTSRFEPGTIFKPFGYKNITGGNVIPAYLSIKNPLVEDADGRDYMAVDVAWWIAKAKSKGHDGLIIENMIDSLDTKVKDPTIVYIAFEPTQIKSVFNQGTFSPNNPFILEQKGKKTRGSITFDDTATTIRLFKAQNMSTFLHESGHFFFKVMGDLVAGENPPAQLVADWETLQNRYGFKKKPGRDAHEAFVRDFEAYLFDGKAPSGKLREVFHRVRSWLLVVYRSLARIGSVPSPEVKAVFDRMLASEESIAEAGAEAEFRPMITEPGEMAPEEWTIYSRYVDRMRIRAQDDLQGQVFRAYAAKARGYMAELKKNVREDVRKQLKDSIVYKTIEALQKGTGRDFHARIDRDALVKQFGPDVVKAMPKNTVAAKDSMHHDMVAELLGWPSGDVMVKALSTAKPFAQAVNDETNRLAEQMYGNRFHNAEAIVAEARQSFHSNERTSVLEAELKTLRKRGGLKASNSPARTIENLARRMVAGKQIREIAQFSKFVSAERISARAAEDAILKNDWVAASEHKRRQLFNHHMGKVAKEALRELDTIHRYVARMERRPKKIDIEYMDQITDLLERFEFKKVSANKLQKRESMLQFIAREEAIGNVVSIPQHLINDAMKKNFKLLTVEEFRGLRDTVKHIEHLGRLKKELKVGRQKMEFQLAREMLEAGIRSSVEARAQSQDINPKGLAIWKRNLESFDAAFLKIEQLVTWLDGGNINGPARKLLWQPVADAEVVKNDMLIKYSKEIHDIFESVGAERMNERVFVQAVGKRFTISDIYAIALNMGTESNYGKMKRGEKNFNAGKEWSDTQVQAIVANLNKEDWDRVQRIWDTINATWADINNLQRELTGTNPTKIESRIVDTPYGDYKGGYFPVVYDRNRSVDVANRETLQADNVFTNTFIYPMTPHGHTKERSEGYSAPMSFDIGTIANHLNVVIHDLTHRKALIGVHRLLSDPGVASAIRDTLGESYRAEFTHWVKRMAHDNLDDGSISVLNRFMRKMRSNATLVGIGLRFSTVFAQTLGWSNAAEMVGSQVLGRGMRMAVSDPVGSWEFIQTNSGEMRHRADQIDRDIRDGIKGLKKLDFHQHQIQKFAYYGIAMADRMVTVPIWMGTYHDHLSKNPNDEAGAIAVADRAVRLSQGSGGAKDLARIQTGPELQKLLTMYYSAFGAMYSRLRDLTRDTRRATLEDIPHLAARYTFLIMIPAVMGELLAGRGPDEDESKVAWAVRRVLTYPAAAVPFLRDVVNGVVEGHGYNASPAFRGVEAFGQFANNARKLVTGNADDDTDRKLVKSGLLTAGYVFGLPTGQLATTVDNIWQGFDENNLSVADIFFARPPK